jgi:hypothetical protein
MHNPSGTKATMEKSGGDHALGCIEVMGYASLLTVASGYSIGDDVEITVSPQQPSSECKWKNTSKLSSSH